MQPLSQNNMSKQRSWSHLTLVYSTDHTKAEYKFIHCFTRNCVKRISEIVHAHSDNAHEAIPTDFTWDGLRSVVFALTKE